MRRGVVSRRSERPPTVRCVERTTPAERTRRIRTPAYSAFVAVACALGVALLSGGEAAFGEEISGLGIGAPTASIPVLDVTGDYAGQRICYVCEFQDDPNVLAFFRDTGEETAALIVALNALYLEHRESGFKAVAAIVAGDSAAPWLEELHARAGIEIPLVVLRRGPNDVAVRLYELNPEVANTFLVTVNRFVAANVADISPDRFDRVAAATAEMLAGL